MALNYGSLLTFLLFIQLGSIVEAVGFAEELYCGLENCYDVLSIQRDQFDKKELSKVYRALAKKNHPDRFRDSVDKADAEKRFRVIATAYETLKDESTKTDYDYYLDHPEERFYNYYQYYRRKMVPKVDVRLVIIGTILSISLFQYFSAKQKYSEAIAYAMTVGKYRNMAINLAVQSGELEMDSKGKLKKKANINNEDVIKKVMEENMDVRGGYKKESVYDTLMWHTICLPYTLFKYACWYAKWAWKYWLKREEFDEEAKLYLIRKQLGVNEASFGCLEEYEVAEMMKRELWIPVNFAEWKAEKDAKEKEKLVNSGRYKQYKRYMKNAGTISFVDED